MRWPCGPSHVRESGVLLLPQLIRLVFCRGRGRRPLAIHTDHQSFLPLPKNLLRHELPYYPSHEDSKCCNVLSVARLSASNTALLYRNSKSDRKSLRVALHVVNLLRGLPVFSQIVFWLYGISNRIQIQHSYVSARARVTQEPFTRLRLRASPSTIVRAPSYVFSLRIGPGQTRTS